MDLMVSARFVAVRVPTVNKKENVERPRKIESTEVGVGLLYSIMNLNTYTRSATETGGRVAYGNR